MKTRKNVVVAVMLACGFCFVSCSKSKAPAKADNTSLPAGPTPGNPAAPAPAVAAAPEAIQGVKAEMRNVLFHLTPVAAAHLVVLSGELWPTGKHEMVVFDDKNSFEVRVTNGTVSITPEALTDIMNNYVFRKSDAPLKDLQVSIDNGRLIIKGKLRTKGDIPFATAGTLNVTDDGRIRVHTEKITALKLPLKGLMGLFGVELANVVNTSKIPGIDTDKNDLLMDLGTLLPPPHIKGKVKAVRVEKNAIVTMFGDGGDSLPAPKETGSFMTFAGSKVQFGSLVMSPADLTVLNVDPKNILEWDQDHYKEQLVAGYSRITPNFGLRAYAKDYSRLGKGGAVKVPGE
jgi:hypothetical protein